MTRALVLGATRDVRPAPAPLKAALRVPVLAWPTLLLTALAFSAWGLAVWSVATDRLAMGWGMLLSTAALYVLFTPMHDAAHQSISRSGWVNGLIGRLCCTAMLGVFVGFRYIHLEHHRHTNEVGKDPDLWSGQGPRWTLPLRWLTQDLYYHVYFAKKIAARPTAERWEVVLTATLLIGGVVALLSSPWAWWTLCLWIVPLKLAFTLLSFSFDYLPHIPHQIPASVDPYRATLARPHPVLRWLLLQQNLHVVHHLHPAAPFYRYAEIWRLRREALIAKGVQVRSVTGRVIEDPLAT